MIAIGPITALVSFCEAALLQNADNSKAKGPLGVEPIVPVQNISHLKLVNETVEIRSLSNYNTNEPQDLAEDQTNTGKIQQFETRPSVFFRSVKKLSSSKQDNLYARLLPDASFNMFRTILMQGNLLSRRGTAVGVVFIFWYFFGLVLDSKYCIINLRMHCSIQTIQFMFSLCIPTRSFKSILYSVGSKFTVLLYHYDNYDILSIIGIIKFHYCS